VAKSSGKTYWAHKASTARFRCQQQLLDAMAMCDTDMSKLRTSEPRADAD
jgi:hypothetical protein